MEITNLASPEAFKQGMRLLTGAVTIVASAGEYGKGGFTATAVCSVSDQPPTLLVCINRQNELLEVMRKNGVFSVNILVNVQENLANRFAGFDQVPMAERLEKGLWVPGSTGGIILGDSLASFECRVSEWVAARTHEICLGEVVAVHTRNGLDPLLYFDRSYRTINK
jgi:flavin reductase (DIM6/NTAB) family NADH-FMN oxidoreductase RutF